MIDLSLYTGAFGEVFNVGSDREITILRLAELVKETSGSPSPIRFVSYERAYIEGFEDMRRRVPDLTKIREAIKFKETKDLLEIVEAVIGYYREHPALLKKRT